MRPFLLLLFLGLTALPAAARADDFPVTLEHIYGSTTFTVKPRRVVSLSFIGHDFLLSLGVVPHALRKWYGPYPYGVWPWGQAALGEAQPIVMQGEIDIEAIAAMEPDLIVGQWSGMTAQEYALLSQIAPTLPPAPGAGDYGMGWQEMLLRLGHATGTAQKAEEIISGFDRRMAALRAAHPDWQGATAVMVWAGTSGAYTARDIRGKFLIDLGFDMPQVVQRVGLLNQSYVTVSDEDLLQLDADALIWLDAGASIDRLNRLPLRPFLRANRQGREIYSDMMLSAALSHSSPLSLDYALTTLVPLLEQALDGDPATEVSSSRAAGILPAPAGGSDDS